MCDEFRPTGCSAARAAARCVLCLAALAGCGGSGTTDGSIAGLPDAGGTFAGAGGAVGGGGVGADGSGGVEPDGAGGAVGGGGGVTDGAGGMRMEEEEKPRPPCLSKASQVIVIGDSYINYNEQLNPDLAARAVADGALAQGEQWRLYALPGASMASGGIAGLIPDQFTQAVLQDPDIIATVMTGGGNDILIPSGFIPGGFVCKDSPESDTIQACIDIVALAIDRAAQLMLDAADAGVQDVVYFFYPHLPGIGLGGMNPNVILDYAYPMAQGLCDGAVDQTGGRLRCHFIDLRPIFEGHDWIQGDGIHPTADGHEALADAIWQVMKDECIAQPASSGCCTP